MTGSHVPWVDESTSRRASHARPVVFVVDGDPWVRESLEYLIRRAGWVPEVCASAGKFLAQPRRFSPGCLVLDTKLPDLDGLDLQHRLADRKDLPIVFVAGCDDVRIAVQAMKAGAVEFLTKPCGDDALLTAIRHAIDRSRRALEEEEQKRELGDCLASLTRREREVMTLVASGLLNKQVGGQLGISEITVKSHRGSVMRKMHARSFADLVNMAAELQLQVAGIPTRSSSAVKASAPPAFVFSERSIRNLVDGPVMEPR